MGDRRSVPGYYGVQGVADLIAGLASDQTTPIDACGHAPDKFAASASSSAAYQNFGNSSVVVYKEGVYVGYKYYETRYEDLVLGQGNADGTNGVFNSTGAWNYAEEMGYPFGWGMSYTTFDQKIKEVTYNAEKDTIDVKVEIKNTGTTDLDKSNKLGKPAIALMAYDKYDVKVGQTIEKTISFDRYFLCTYDYVSTFPDGKKGGYLLEGGDYYFALGNGAHEALNNIISVKHPTASLYDHNGDAYTGKADAVASLNFAEDKEPYRNSDYNADFEVVNQFDDADFNYVAQKNNKSQRITYLNREDWNGTWPTKVSSSDNPASSADSNMANYYTKSANAQTWKDKVGETTSVVYIDDDGNESLIKFSEMNKVPLEGDVTDPSSRFYGKDGAQVWDDFIKQMSVDDLCISVSDNRGILDVAKVKKKGNSVAEGPEGLLSRYQYDDKRWATGYPTGPSYTGTWDHEMQAKFGAFYGEDALFCGVACVNAPGCNINRTPYGSRASEYMSEDGILNYNTAANIVSAARKKGLSMNIKHCFLNNQESGRQRIHTYCNEQAIREIYLKPFEGALTKGRSLGIMTSYNRIGARYAACHEPLMKNVMRGEWKYQGQIIDDALTGGNTDQYSNGPAMLHCGTDLFCLDGGRGGQLKQFISDNDDGDLLEDLQRANKYIMYSISRSWMGGIDYSDFGKKAWQKAVDGTVIGLSIVTGGLLITYVVFEVLAKVKKPAEAKEEASGEVAE